MIFEEIVQKLDPIEIFFKDVIKEDNIKITFDNLEIYQISYITKVESKKIFGIEATAISLVCRGELFVKHKKNNFAGPVFVIIENPYIVCNLVKENVTRMRIDVASMKLNTIVTFEEINVKVNEIINRENICTSLLKSINKSINQKIRELNLKLF